MAAMKFEWYITIIFYFYLYVRVCILWVCATCVYPRRPEEGIGLLKLELQVVLQTELLSTARKAYAFNWGAISLATSIILTSTCFS